MKLLFTAGLLAGVIIVAAQAQGEPSATRVSAPPASVGQLGDWTRPLAPGAGPAHGKAAAAISPEAPLSPSPAGETGDLDVVDGHWMALTMWGEARSEGEEAMRAVGHVIDNRRRSGGHGAFVTETVSEAWQFSCWNEGDPNREAMLGVLDLPKDSREYRLWLAARSIADEILAGRSEDPTGGALFYHTTAVAPRWSRGLAPVRRIGTHLFFRSVRQA